MSRRQALALSSMIVPVAAAGVEDRRDVQGVGLALQQEAPREVGPIIVTYGFSHRADDPARHLRLRQP